ncbi:zinc-binding dehydrogenase [Nocardioides sp. zg-ZUI104]|uniref:zinc-dependent alcohol dehydrogenase n=1 Tax=Nocardioides faecalis TaxID=2803858 RepID=UPI001BCB486C|nr:zinc-binding dehydrogenase [Nocardioides faecalis]MBS4751937.1 zinc-binding dehydrogenase [Nocardioides faecalis]
MLAAVLHGFNDLRIEAVPDPRPAPDECLLQVDCVQPSITEAMLIAGHRMSLHEHLADRLGAGPVQFGGHEFAATVLDTGADAAIPPGTRVVAAETVTCGRCSGCLAGREAACTAPSYLGFTRPGAFAELVAVPVRNLLPVPPSLSDGEVAALQPLVGALHAHRAARLSPGASVLVIGTGVMGLLALQVARRGNAGPVVALGRTPPKLDLARRLGADHAVTPGDLDRITADVTAGRGFDVVIETAGGAPAAGLSGAATVATAAAAVSRGGTIVVVSVLPSDSALPLDVLREKGVTVRHPLSGRHDGGADLFAHALRLVARGDVDLAGLLTHRLEGITELPNALDMIVDKKAHGVINPPQVHLTAEVS